MFLKEKICYKMVYYIYFAFKNKPIFINRVTKL